MRNNEGKRHTWDYDRRFLRVDPIIRRNVFHVVNGEILRWGGAHWCGYRSNDLGRIKALFEVRFGERVGGGPSGGATTPSPRTLEVEPVSVVWPETTATSSATSARTGEV